MITTTKCLTTNTCILHMQNIEYPLRCTNHSSNELDNNVELLKFVSSVLKMNMTGAFEGPIWISSVRVELESVYSKDKYIHVHINPITFEPCVTVNFTLTFPLDFFNHTIEPNLTL